MRTVLAFLAGVGLMLFLAYYLFRRLMEEFGL